MIEPIQLAWVAGFFDADGCISIRRTLRHDPTRRLKGMYYQLVIDITQSGKLIPITIVKLVELFGGTPLLSKDKRLNRVPRWSWRIVSRQAVNFLQAILPYSIGKHEQIVLGIEFQEKVVGKGSYRNIVLQEEYYQHMSALKHYTKRTPS